MTAALSAHVQRAMRKLEKPRAWPPEAGLSDGRLVFLAAKPALDVLAQTRLGIVWQVFERGSPRRSRGSFGRNVPTQHMTAEARGERMNSLVFACDELVRCLTAAELHAVRASGQLPTWFIPAVDDAAREIRKQWKNSSG